MLNSSISLLHMNHIEMTKILQASVIRLHFLNINIIKVSDELKFKIYRKSTATNIVIHASSYHPFDQNIAAFNSLIYRAVNVPMNNFDFKNKIKIIKMIARNNGYNNKIIDCIIRKQQINKSKKKFNLGR